MVRNGKQRIVNVMINYSRGLAYLYPPRILRSSVHPLQCYLSHCMVCDVFLRKDTCCPVIPSYIAEHE